MLLTSTTKLEFDTGSGTDVVFAAAWNDDSASGLTASSGTGTSDGATAVDVVAAPAPGTTRMVDWVHFRNTGTVDRTLTIRLDVSGTDLSLRTITLRPGGCYQYTRDGGWPDLVPDSVSMGGWSRDYLKGGTVAEAAGSTYAYLKDAGLPGAFAPGTPGMSGRTIDGTTEGGIIPYVNPASGNHFLRDFAVSGSVLHTYELYDLLWIQTGISVTTTTAQTVNSVTFPSRDIKGEINGRGCRIGLLVTAATTNAAAIANSTVTYTNSDGVGSRTATLIAVAGLQIPATAVVGTTVWYQLQAGDNGVQSIQSVTLGTSLVSGSVSLILARKLASGRVTVANVEASGLSTPVRLYDGTAMFVAYVASTTTATQCQATITVENKT